MRKIALLVLPLLLSGCAEMQFLAQAGKMMGEDQASTEPAKQYKVGKPYQIEGKTYYPREDWDYVEIGSASWYGDEFDGRPTANGEKFDKDALTAAHRTLPMPSLVRVTNLENGRTAILRVNDRGPFSRGRIIDVSHQAARVLGFDGKGTAKVKVELLADESKDIATRSGGQITEQPRDTRYETGFRPEGRFKSALIQPVEAAELPQPIELSKSAADSGASISSLPPGPVLQSNGVYIQAGAFASEQNAQKLSQSLSPLGSTNIVPLQKAGKTLYRVRLGPLKNVDEAHLLLDKMSAKGVSSAKIITE